MMKEILAVLFALLWISQPGAAKAQDDFFADPFACTRNGEIILISPGNPEGTKITSGESAHALSWSPDGKWIVFSKVLNETQDVSLWKTAICIVRPDGSGFRQLTSGSFADYDPTWSREGSNFIILNRFSREKWKCFIYRTGVNSKPGEEELISDPEYSEYGHSYTKDGRILANSDREKDRMLSYALSSGPESDGFYKPPILYFLTPETGKIGKYERLKFSYKLYPWASRLALSMDESRIVYELDSPYGSFSYNGHPIVFARIDVKDGVVSNPVTVSQTRFDHISIHPVFSADGKGIVYFSNKSGKYQLYFYDFQTRTTKIISLNPGQDIKYYCGEGVSK